MRRWISFLFGGLKRRAGNALWAGMTEVVLAATLLLIGIVVLIVSITLAVQYSSPTELYISIWTFALQLLVGIALASIGIYRVLVTFWKVGASAERRGPTNRSNRDRRALERIQDHEANQAGTGNQSKSTD